MDTENCHTQHPDHTIYLGFGFQVKMDGLHLVSKSPVSSVKVDQQKGQGGPTSERSSSIKPFTARRFSVSNSQSQSRNKGLPNKVSRCNALPGDPSCQTSFNNNDSCVITPTGSNASNAISKVEKSIKRNSKKKARKKDNRNKRPGLTNLECVGGSSTFETGVAKNTDYVIAAPPYGTRLAVLSPQINGNGSDLEGNSGGGISFLERPKICTSYIDEGDILEAKLIGEHRSPAENGVLADFHEFSILGGVQDTHSNPSSCLNDPFSSGYSETNESSVLDSTSFCSNDEKLMYASYKVSTKGNGGTNLPNPPGYITRNGLLSLPNILNGVGDSFCDIEETTTCENGFTNGDMVQRGRQIKDVPRNPSISWIRSSGKFTGRLGKENNQTVWQKVQRNDTEECSSGLRKVNSDNSWSGAGLKGVQLLKKKSNGAQYSMLSKCEGKSESKVKLSRKLKRRTSLGSKQALSNYSRKVSYTTKTSSTVCRKINVQQNEVFDISAQCSGKKGLNSNTSPCSKISFERVGFLGNKIGSITSEPVCILESHPSELEPLEHVCAALSVLNDQTAKTETCSLSGSCDYSDQTEIFEGQSTEYLYPPGGEGTNISKNVSPLDHNKQEQNRESTLGKWRPVRIKHYELAMSDHSNSLQLAYLSKPAGGIYPLENAVREMASDRDNSSFINASLCSGQGARDHIGLHSKYEVQIEKHPSQRTCTPKESHLNQVAAKCFTPELREQNYIAVETESNKIAQAVNDAYRAQLASEAVQMATGYPIAEFEKLLSSAAPVISLPHSILSCQICLADEIVGVSLCRHETPDISLRSLWQWYEKHGTYGLEVRAKECDNSKRLGIDRVAFRAYFVPFLSAVQLFRNSKSPLDSSSTAAGKEAMEETCTFDKRLANSSNVGCLPIFSLLFPRPHMGTSSCSPMKSICCSEMSSVAIDGNETLHLDDSTSSEELELLFEYFEVEQPQKRRPLFEMIKELVRGDGPSKCRAYGDPTKLDSVALNDLHHKSWYSVAWYPIYRIPDDNFRAAFLTYHSLGHLVRQSVTSDSFGVGASVVSPIVGLQSYNAQGECWFQLRQSELSQTREIAQTNYLGILEERLRTLEHTASLMARAIVTKEGNLTSVNRQPDYEFFLSRRCW